ncbi:hypothetical protein EMIHUDRAFT_232476 [Emiliania huxleyi CCMP1516]|uniref:c-Myc-binding protein n=3 Tax=Emiliania huxleyi TaxID=2903 RepID=A0A0D3ICI1_EMIH1|nr:hypothetical protein EMIHUDRAFT_428176 [Emiliania huxleyi CCMP1516]XP_005783112.1 hypothetical protein EMIHUDRAFT_232476 [Emiliania huxleyi CCMP1516]EOD08966.1 hypothetical protein EMIHUDRAFT_428176 [Emiliania huxleyi CCMP1516]EOD30683.1 hypothetical protein EMIHUDRAFT_232476 [Emiliania huxleyi CCMP1516]|eukprot:XP_005761395.1 hypothetical protein EMIHUDRAFT_428176 [Emiliania huxleyi CCMP1516]
MAAIANAAVSSLTSPDAKKEEFRKYLERSGVIDALTKVLVGLYEEPEKPSNAIEFIKMTLGAPTGVDVDQLKAENETLRAEAARLREKVGALEEKLGGAAAEE